MTKLLLLAVSSIGFAQTLSLSGNPAFPGGTATVNVNLSGSTGSGIAALQWSVALPATPIVSIGPAAGPMSLTCAAISGTTTCVLVGFPVVVVPSDGVLAQIKLPVAATASGSIPLTITNQLGTDSAGLNPIVVAVGPAFSLVLLNRCDLNSDGLVNVVDVKSAIDQVSGVAVCSSADINGDGKCTVVDVQRAIFAANGGICKVN